MSTRPDAYSSFRCRLFLVFSLLSFFVPGSTWAGCGCDKPPPQPAAVIPHVAFPGMSVTLSDKSFIAGQT